LTVNRATNWPILEIFPLTVKLNLAFDLVQFDSPRNFVSQLFPRLESM